LVRPFVAAKQRADVETTLGLDPITHGAPYDSKAALNGAVTDLSALRD